MARVEKSVFLSYRRTNVSWALSIYQNLMQHGYDVFFDFQGTASGDFESQILENVRGRAHFLVLLTPSALERCAEPGDWLRREIETALEAKRNIVPLMIEGFDFGAPAIAPHLTGKLADLRQYNAISVPAEFFLEAMGRLRDRHLNVALDAVAHPVSTEARQATVQQQAAAAKARPVQQEELTAEQWFERGVGASDLGEKIRCYSEVIHLQPGAANAYNNRGNARRAKGDLDGALADYTEALRLKPDHVYAYNNRGVARREKGDLKGALADHNEALRLQPDFPDAYNNRGADRQVKGDLKGALADYTEALRLQPDFPKPYYNRATALLTQGDLDGALADYTEALRLQPDDVYAYFNRARLLQHKGQNEMAIADYQKYLDLGGGVRDGDQAKVEQIIRDLRGSKPKHASAKGRRAKKAGE